MQTNRIINPQPVQSKNGMWRFIDLFYPPICCRCGTLGLEICDSCYQTIELAPKSGICERCGSISRNRTVCKSCQEDPPNYNQLRFWGIYEGTLKTIIQNIKYKRSFGLIEYLKHELASFIQDWNIDFDLIVPVPLGRKRQRERGFNQSAKVSIAVGKILEKPVNQDSLQRIRETRTQVGLNNTERQNNVRDAFRANETIFNGKDVLLVDDIATTGATINACSKALRMGGAARVFCFTVAKTNND